MTRRSAAAAGPPPAMATRSSIGSFRLMRRIDQYLGPPACVALGLLRRLLARGPAPSGGPPRRILVIKFWGMGSIVLTTPALRALRRAHPGAAITFLTFAQNETICRAIDAIDRVHPFRADSLPVFASSCLALLRVLRRERFDVVLDLEFFANFTALVTGLSGAPVTVGFHTPKFWRAAFYTAGVPFEGRHITENFLQAAAALGAVPDGAGLDPLPARDAAVAALDRRLAAHGVRPGERLVCINVNASSLDHKRRWPLASYRRLIERLLAAGEPWRVVLIGAPEDAAYVAPLRAALPPAVVDLSGAIDVAELIALLHRAHLFIGNDSGPLHLAAAAGVPTVSFFGPETPALYGPRGAGHTILYKGVACSPCLNVHNSKDNSACRDNVCLKTISVDEAWEAVRARLDAAAAASWPAEAVR